MSLLTLQWSLPSRITDGHSKPALVVYALAGAIVLRNIYTYCFRSPRRTVAAKVDWLLKDVPIIGCLPLFGVLISEVLKAKHLDFAAGIHEKFGKTFCSHTYLGPWWIMTTNPKNVEYMLSGNFKNYPKGSFMTDKLGDLLGHGIFNADGQNWLHQRKTASQMFTQKLFKEHIWVVVNRNATKLRDIMLEAADSVDAGQPLDVFNLMNRFTLDTIGEIGFGKSIGSLEDSTSPFLKSFDRAQQIVFFRFLFAGWKVLRWMGWGFESETAEHFNVLDGYSRNVVRELRDRIANEAGQTPTGADFEARKSFVGLFLADAAKKGAEPTEDYLRDLVLNFLIAGRDTTAQALSWTIYCLCNHPEIARKARDEIREVCGVKGPDYDDVNRLPYLQAIIHEVLRLYPSVPINPKFPDNDDTLPDGTFVPRGTAVFYNSYAMGRCKSIWGEDAKEFRPERWLEMTTMPSNYSYPVFHAGPRECLGRRLAQVEMKTCLAMLLPVLSFELAVPASEITTDCQLTIGMATGLPCFVGRVTDKEARQDSCASTATPSD